MFDDTQPRPNGASAFFTVSLADPGGARLTDHIGRLNAAVALTRRVRPFYADAWVVLPDHLHCVLTLPVGDTDFAGRWRTIRNRFARRPIAGAGPGPLWHDDIQEHRIADMADYADRIRACWFDPVHHALAARPEDWAYSSIHMEVDEDRSAA